MRGRIWAKIYNVGVKVRGSKIRCHFQSTKGGTVNTKYSYHVIYRSCFFPRTLFGNVDYSMINYVM